MLDETADFAVGSLVGLAAWLFGGLDGYLNVLLTFVIIDFILGFLDRFSNHKLRDFTELFQKISRKITILCLVAVAHIVDKNFLGNTSTLKFAVTIFYTVTEFTSILRHANNLGLPVPKFLTSKLKNLQAQLGKIEDETTQQIIDDHFDIREFINLEEAKEAEEIEQIDRIEKAAINRDFIENLTGVPPDDFNF